MSALPLAIRSQARLTTRLALKPASVHRGRTFSATAQTTVQATIRSRYYSNPPKIAHQPELPCPKPKTSKAPKFADNGDRMDEDTSAMAQLRELKARNKELEKEIEYHRESTTTTSTNEKSRSSEGGAGSNQGRGDENKDKDEAFLPFFVATTVGFTLSTVFIQYYRHATHSTLLDSILVAITEKEERERKESSTRLYNSTGRVYIG